jgi:GNAT superfamily N-acetyltransferase
MTDRNDLYMRLASSADWHQLADLRWRLMTDDAEDAGRLDGSWGYLTNCYVLPPYRKEGVGSGLLDAVKGWAEAQRLELLVVWPSERSYPFYERSGLVRYPDPLVLKLDTDRPR